MFTRALVVTALAVVPMFAAETPDQRIHAAKEVFSEIMSAPDRGIPADLLERAACIVIIPSMKRGGFIVGAHYGVGVADCRTHDKMDWSGPATVKMEGGSIGLQLGAGETDLVLLIMNHRGAERLMHDQFTLGGDASAMAGPVGRSATAETDPTMRAEILSWSRSHGVFGGIDLKAGTLRADNDANALIYGHGVNHEAILNGRIRVPAAAQGLVDELNQYPARPSKGPVSDHR